MRDTCNTIAPPTPGCEGDFERGITRTLIDRKLRSNLCICLHMHLVGPVSINGRVFVCIAARDPVKGTA